MSGRLSQLIWHVRSRPPYRQTNRQIFRNNKPDPDPDPDHPKLTNPSSPNSNPTSNSHPNPNPNPRYLELLAKERKKSGYVPPQQTPAPGWL